MYHTNHLSVFDSYKRAASQKCYKISFSSPLQLVWLNYNHMFSCQWQALHSKLCISSSRAHSGAIPTNISGRSAWVSTTAFGSHVKIPKHFQYIVLSHTLLYVSNVKQMVSAAVSVIWQNMLASVVRWTLWESWTKKCVSLRLRAAFKGEARLLGSLVMVFHL